MGIRQVCTAVVSAIVSKRLFGFSVYAAPGSNSATFEFDLDSFAASDILNLPSVPLYLDIIGTTTAPVAITDLTPGASPDYLTFTAPLTVDFTVTLSDTPFTPSSTPPVTGIPEPWTWTIVLAGLAGVMGLRRGPLRMPGPASDAKPRRRFWTRCKYGY